MSSRPIICMLSSFLPRSRPHSAGRAIAPAVLILVLSMVIFVQLAIRAHEHGVFEWDAKLSRAINAPAKNDNVLNQPVDFAEIVLHPAFQVSVFVWVTCVCVAALILRRAQAAAFILLAVAGSVVLGPILKELVERPSVIDFERPLAHPDREGHAFPSGHALRSMTAVGALALLAWPTRRRWTVTLVGGAFALITGIAVVYKEWHWVSDVFGAWCISVAWLALLWLLLRPPY